MTKPWKTFIAGTVLAIAAAMTATVAGAREPGVPPSVPPGNTLGLPIGASPPPGFYLNSLSSTNSLTLKDASGNSVGADVTLSDTAVQLMWVPGIKLFGGDYKAFILQPLLNIDQDSTFAPVASGSKLGLGNTEIHPIDISWALGGGHFVSAGFSVFAPTGYWSASAPVNTAGNFWTFAPSLGYSYLNDGWNTSIHLQYFTNTRNKTSKYRSGNEVLVNVTAMKDLGGFSLGPIAYYRKQLQADSNGGTMYGGTVAGKAEQLALGLGYAGRVGAANVNVNLTHDVMAKNTLGGTSLHVNFSIPLGGK